MRIAVFHNLPTGGAKRVLHGFVCHLIESGHLVDVFVPSTAREDFLPLRDVGARVTVFPVPKTFFGSLYSFLRYVPPMEVSWRDLEWTQRDIANAIDKGEYDIVFCEQDRFTMSPFFLKFIKKPTVYFCQQPSRFNEKILREVSRMAGYKDNLNPVRRWIRRQFAKRTPRIDRKNASHARYVLVNSNFSRESVLRSYGLDSHVSYLGVDTGVFKPSGVPRENFVLSIGECAPKKGFDFLIRSLALIDHGIRPRLVLVCNSFNPGWREYLEQLAKQEAVDMEIMSLVGDEELVALYNRARLVLCAAYLEPFGLTPIEAMACGTPVIAVKEGGFKESVVHDQTGRLAERDPREFSKAISQLLGEPDVQRSMGQKGISAVRDFWTLKHAGERLEAHLRKALETYPK
jgi:glycosyltransferase involved in cell wall biosynthesis